MGARAETIAPTAEPAVQTSGSGTMVCTPSSSTLGFSLHKDRGWWHSSSGMSDLRAASGTSILPSRDFIDFIESDTFDKISTTAG